MRSLRRTLLVAFAVVAGATAGHAAAAVAASDGGTAYPSPTGGSEFGRVVHPVRIRPVARLFVVAPRRVREGRMPVVRYRIDEEATKRVRVRVAVVPLRGAHSQLSVAQGLRRVGRTWRVRWGHGTHLRPGVYLVRLHVRDPKGRTLLRTAHASGLRGLRVVAKPRPKPKPAPVAPEPEPVPVPDPAPAPGGVFPVAGAYTLGDGVGVIHHGHVHEGQDILAAEGTPVVAPTAGTVTFVGDQPSAAGRYVVMHSADGAHDFFFAHCRTNTTVVAAGAPVVAGARLCSVGHTGDASGPHLHFEVWAGAWRQGGHWVDPLPFLRTWSRR